MRLACVCDGWIAPRRSPVRVRLAPLKAEEIRLCVAGFEMLRWVPNTPVARCERSHRDPSDRRPLESLDLADARRRSTVTRPARSRSAPLKLRSRASEGLPLSHASWSAPTSNGSLIVTVLVLASLGASSPALGSDASSEPNVADCSAPLRRYFGDTTDGTVTKPRCARPIPSCASIAMDRARCRYLRKRLTRFATRT